MGKVYAIANNKGGVGKTTTTVNLGDMLAQKLLGEDGGKPLGAVLLVDMDPQGNLADALGLRGSVYDERTNPAGKCISQLLLGQKGLRDVWVSAHRPADGLHRPNLFLIPASRELENATAELMVRQITAQFTRRSAVQLDSILSHYLGPVRKFFRYILIDCPPKLDTFKPAVYEFADEVIVPTQADILSGRGTQQHTADLLQLMKEANLSTRLRFVVPTMYDGRLRVSRFMLEQLKKVYGRNVVAGPIRMDVRLREAAGVSGKTAREHAPDSAGALAYQELADRIWREDGNGK